MDGFLTMAILSTFVMLRAARAERRDARASRSIPGMFISDIQHQGVLTKNLLALYSSLSFPYSSLSFPSKALEELQGNYQDICIGPIPSNMIKNPFLLCLFESRVAFTIRRRTASTITSLSNPHLIPQTKSAAWKAAPCGSCHFRY